MLFIYCIIVNIYQIPYFLYVLNGKISIVDELDSNIHDLLIAIIINSLSNSIEGQFIFTTHNTSLLERKELVKAFYFIQTDVDGDKEILSLNDFDRRTHRNHNVRIQFLNGYFGGIPFIANVDFDYLKNEINSRDILDNGQTKKN